MNARIIRYAIETHQNCNNLYNGAPYSVHLAMVAMYAQKYIDCIPDEARENVLCACWLHDTIEDCRVTYNDIATIAGKEIADIVYAVTNEKGKNRFERANDKYYEGIRATAWATFVKLCDRLANVHYSLMTGSKMIEVYRSENTHFLKELFPRENKHYGKMVDELNELLKKKYQNMIPNASHI